MDRHVLEIDGARLIATKEPVAVLTGSDATREAWVIRREGSAGSLGTLPYSIHASSESLEEAMRTLWRQQPFLQGEQRDA